MTRLALLAIVVALAVVGYFVMIDVKPGVERPLPDARAQAAVRALEPPLMQHVRTLAGEIGERNVWRPEASGPRRLDARRPDPRPPSGPRDSRA
jgi:hypothetical protein